MCSLIYVVFSSAPVGFRQNFSDHRWHFSYFSFAYKGNWSNGCAVVELVTFAIYHQQDGGAPIWLETQNVTPDSTGHYTVLLGSTKAEGIPADLFSTQEQRWLGVQMQGEAEQPRVLLVSVPYAMKAADAETIGGLPLSAFVLASPNSASAAVTSMSSAPQGLVTGTTPQVLAAGPRPVITGSGTVNQLAKFDCGSRKSRSV